MSYPLFPTLRVQKASVIILFLLTAAFMQISTLHAAIPFAHPSEIDITAAENGITIIGGEEVQSGAYPWMVAIVENKHENILWGQYCGGSLIHPEWILTAAHCTYDFGREMVPSDIDVLVGQDKLDTATGERISVAQIIRHPGYNSAIGDTDIALLKLVTPSVQRPVKMADISLSNIDSSGAVGTVLGWGRTATKSRVNHLHQVKIPLVNAETCTTAYRILGYTMTANMLCAGYQQGGQDACAGDSGGPLIIREIEGNEASQWIQVGIISWGKGCAQADAYGVYTHVAIYKSWVDVQIALNSFATDSGSTAILPEGQDLNRVQIYMPIIN